MSPKLARLLRNLASTTDFHPHCRTGPSDTGSKVRTADLGSDWGERREFAHLSHSCAVQYQSLWARYRPSLLCSRTTGSPVTSVGKSAATF
jgi:hypothetical protein